jgi:hypothetical protein
MSMWYYEGGGRTSTSDNGYYNDYVEGMWYGLDKQTL